MEWRDATSAYPCLNWYGLALDYSQRLSVPELVWISAGLQPCLEGEAGIHACSQQKRASHGLERAIHALCLAHPMALIRTRGLGADPV